MTDNEKISLKEHIDLSLSHLRDEISSLRRAIEELSRTRVRFDDYQDTKSSLSEVAMNQRNILNRLEALEHSQAVGLAVLRFTMGIASALIIASLAAWLLA